MVIPNKTLNKSLRNHVHVCTPFFIVHVVKATPLWHWFMNVSTCILPVYSIIKDVVVPSRGYFFSQFASHCPQNVYAWYQVNQKHWFILLLYLDILLNIIPVTIHRFHAFYEDGANIYNYESIIFHSTLVKMVFYQKRDFLHRWTSIYGWYSDKWSF